MDYWRKLLNESRLTILIGPKDNSMIQRFIRFKIKMNSSFDQFEIGKLMQMCKFSNVLAEGKGSNHKVVHHSRKYFDLMMRL